MAPDLNSIRNGQYWGIFTSSFLAPNFLFLIFGVGGVWGFGKPIEARVGTVLFVFLIASTVIFCQLFEILLFDRNGYDLGGIVYGLFGCVWFKSIHGPNRWWLSEKTKYLMLLWIILCTLVNYTKVLEIAVGVLFGGLVWGLFIGFITTSNNKTLRFSVPIFILGIFFIPIFWAPWQVSWLSNEAYKYHQQYFRTDDPQALEKAKQSYEVLLKVDQQNDFAQKGLKIIELDKEGKKYFEQGDLKNAKKSTLKALEIDPKVEGARERLRIIELQEEFVAYFNQHEFRKAENTLNQMLTIRPDKNEEIEKTIRITKLYEKFFEYINNNKIEKAKNVINEILEINPNDEFAKENLRKLK